MWAASADGRRSGVLTLLRRRRRAFTRYRPMNPCPPVTIALRMTEKGFAILLEHLLGKGEVVGPADIEPDAIISEADHVAIACFDLQQQVRHVEIIDMAHVGPYGLALENIDSHADIVFACRLFPVRAKPIVRVELDQPEINLVFPFIDPD